MRGVGEQGDEPRRQDQGPDGPQYNVGAEPEVGLQGTQHNHEEPDEQGHGSTMTRRGQATDGEGSQDSAKQRPGSKAGHQLCLLRRRHSPARGSKDTAVCPQLRLVQTKVMHCYKAEIVTLMILFLLDNLGTGELLQGSSSSKRASGVLSKAKCGWSALGRTRRTPRTGVG